MSVTFGRPICTNSLRSSSRPTIHIPPRNHRLKCKDTDEIPPPPQLTESSPESTSGGLKTNQLLAGGAVGFGVGLFLFTRVLSGGPTFSDLEAQATSYDLAQANGKPTVVEFYARWCEVCREMLPDTLSVEEEFKDDINFVALNVENTKWTPEILEYNVDGIPHFEFLDSDQTSKGTAVGRLPKKILEANLAALAGKKDLPFKQVKFEASSMKKAPTSMSGTSPMPRDHGP